MALLLQVLVTGLAAGAGYGLVAIGIALIWRLTGVIHFALGEFVSLAVFVALAVAVGTGPVSRTNVPVARFALGLMAALAVSVAVNAALYLMVVRPFVHRGSAAGWIGGVVAAAFAVRGLIAATFVRQSYVFPDVIPFGRLSNGGVIRLGGDAVLPVRTFYVIAVGVVLVVAASSLLGRTTLGAALRAVADDPFAARAIGLPVDRLLTVAFGAAGVLAAVAAVVGAPSAPVTADAGALLGLKGLVAALLGGFGSPRKVFAAGLAVGVLETAVASLHLGGLRLGPAYRDIIPLGLALLVMAVRHRPQAIPDAA